MAEAIIVVNVGGLLMDEGQKKQTTIFFIEEDDETRRPLVSNLRGYGYRVIVAVDVEDALEMVGSVEANLVLVNLVGKTADEVLKVGRLIRQHSKYNGRTSLVVMPEKYDKALEDTEVNVGVASGSSTSARSPTDCATSWRDSRSGRTAPATIVISRTDIPRLRPAYSHPGFKQGGYGTGVSLRGRRAVRGRLRHVDALRPPPVGARVLTSGTLLVSRRARPPSRGRGCYEADTR